MIPVVVVVRVWPLIPPAWCPVPDLSTRAAAANPDRVVAVVRVWPCCHRAWCLGVDLSARARPPIGTPTGRRWP